MSPILKMTDMDKLNKFSKSVTLKTFSKLCCFTFKNVYILIRHLGFIFSLSWPILLE